MDKDNQGRKNIFLTTQQREWIHEEGKTSGKKRKQIISEMIMEADENEDFNKIDNYEEIQIRLDKTILAKLSKLGRNANAILRHLVDRRYQK